MNQDSEKSSLVLAYQDAIDLFVDHLLLEPANMDIKLIDINHPLLFNEKIIEQIKLLCLHQRNFNCRIIAEKLRPNKRLNLFIHYYQRLTDKIKIRRYIPPQVEPDKRQYICIGNTLAAWQNHPTHTDFRVFDTSYRVKQFKDSYMSTFEQALADNSLSKLYL